MMMRSKNLILFILLLNFSLAGCKKGNGQPKEPPVTKPPVANDDPAQYGSPFNNVPNTEDVVMYEVNLRAFSAAGTFKGVQERLDSIKNLGVNVIWLMPIHPMGALKGIGSPYAVKNYMEVAAEYGTLDDLRSLVDEAHARNIAVLMDWVANHTAWDNPWIQNKAWYTQDGSGNIISPAGMGWNDVADLNYNNADMRTAMIKAMKYWVLTANVDGFRCDYANGAPQTFWKAAIDTLRKIPNRKLMMLAEGDRKDHFSAGFNLSFGFNFFGILEDVYNSNSPAAALVASNSSEYNAVPAGSHVLRYTSNHDNNIYDGTPIDLFKGERGSMGAFVLASYMGGVPLIYTAQEIGYTSKIPFFTKSTVNWNSGNPAMTAEYKKLIAFRKSSAAVKSGTIAYYTNSPDVVAFKRTSGSEQVVVLVNVRGTEVTYALDPSLSGTSWTNVLTSGSVSFSTNIKLSPYSYLILRK